MHLRVGVGVLELPNPSTWSSRVGVPRIANPRPPGSGVGVLELPNPSALADWSSRTPAFANSSRLVGEFYSERWGAGVRNPRVKGERPPMNFHPSTLGFAIKLRLRLVRCGMAATATPSWPHATPGSSHMRPEASGGAREVAWRGGECSSRWACKWGCEARRWVLSWWARSTCRLPWPRQHGDQAPPNDLAVVDITHPIAIGPCPIATNPQGTSPVAWWLP